ncbi:hypothetical protein NIES2100_42890 [Calothrix sp. NIES-2100]|uniref:DUF3598 family protein n=1 Tax=Calothrix sp. NIES-2100 TaxID=1954172 RepID=UPI000B61C157|nr:hypothetical protein NIES2100_42890 [Calothrix sp. NIES-2100]
MNAQEQNWSNLFAHHTPEGMSWHGIWTRYSPDLEVIQSFQGIRSFRANEDKTVIYQTNNYTYADGSTEEKNWQLDKQTSNQPDGIIHTAIPSMRALSIAPGVQAWLSKTFEPGKHFGMELFFRHEDWRNSVSVIYGENSAVEKITHIREHLGSFPAETPGAKVKTIEGKWIGKKQYITPDLTVSNAETIQNLVLAPLEEQNQTFFLPDGIVINAPTSLSIGQEFDIIAGRFVSENQFKRLTAKYDNFGNFQLLISEIFHRQI